MKKYTEPEVEITKFLLDDVITLSSAGALENWDEETMEDW